MTFPNFLNKKITVIGDLMLDEYWLGSVNRISPEAPVPIVNIANKSYKVGGAGNVAMNIAMLGVKVNLISSIGTDEEGKIIKKILKKNKIYTNFQISKNKKTIKKLRILNNNQQMMRLDFDGDKNDFILKYKKKLSELIKQSNVIVFSDYEKGCLSEIQKLIKISNRLKKTIVIDPKGNDFYRYKNSTILTPNLKEFENIVGKINNDRQLVSKGKNLIKELNLTALLVTRGSQGMTLITNKDSFKLEALAEEVYDVTGAGDTVVALIASCLAANLNFYQAANYANIAASLVVKKIGTEIFDLNELKKAMKLH